MDFLIKQPKEEEELIVSMVQLMLIADLIAMLKYYIKN